MDQAASILGRAGAALRVSFGADGTTAVPVPLPPAAGFVVAHTLAQSKKAETAAYHYNLRVVECRLAAAVLGTGLGLGPRDAAKLATLRDVEPFAEAKYGGDGVSTTQACLAAVEALLKKEPYSQADVETAVALSIPDLLDHNATQLKSVAVAPDKGGFHLAARARHVYSEAARVGEFADVCARARARGHSTLPPPPPSWAPSWTPPRPRAGTTTTAPAPSWTPWWPRPRAPARSARASRARGGAGAPCPSSPRAPRTRSLRR